MTPKLIISSIVGVTAIGGGITGGYYAFNSNTQKSANKDKDQTTEDKSKKTSTQSAPKKIPVTSTQTTITRPETVTASPSNTVNSDTRGSTASRAQLGTGGTNGQLPSR